MATTGAGTGPTVDRREVRRTSLVSLLGSTIEWYDFFIYGTAAALVLNTAFFPNADPFLGTLAAFSSFAVGFIARPVGGIIWGHFGDRIGRKKALVSALFLMGASTTLVGLLPSYATIGVAAPILLFVLRILQGLAVGGQWGGAVLIATEYAPPHRKGFYGSFPQLGVPVAVILSNGIFLGLEAGLGEEAFTAWGWRVPFLLSVLLIGVALYAQLRLEDTPAFKQIQQQGDTQKRSPVLEVLRSHPKQVVLAAGSFVAVNGGFYLYIIYALSYGTKVLKLPESTMLIGILGSSAVNLALIPAFALLSDRIGRRPVYLAGAIGTVLVAFPVFWLIDTRSTFMIFLGLLHRGDRELRDVRPAGGVLRRAVQRRGALLGGVAGLPDRRGARRRSRPARRGRALPGHRHLGVDVAVPAGHGTRHDGVGMAAARDAPSAGPVRCRARAGCGGGARVRRLIRRLILRGWGPARRPRL